MPLKRYMLTFYVPPSHLQVCLDACFAAGAGTWSTPPSLSSTTTTGLLNGTPSISPSLSTPSTKSSHSKPLYENCAFITRGTGTFRPTAAADPYIGKPAGGQVELEECRVETVIDPSLPKETSQDGSSGNETRSVTDALERVRGVVEALRKAHPYEVVALGVVEILDL